MECEPLSEGELLGGGQPVGLEGTGEGATWLSAGEEHLCNLKGPQDKQVKGRDRLVVKESQVQRGDGTITYNI